MMKTADPTCLCDFKKLAETILDANAWGYYSSGANQEQTLRDNEEAYLKYRLKPRVLRDVSNVDLKTSILGNEVDFPVGIAPTGSHMMAHKDGERATAQASSKIQSLFILCVWSNNTLEDVAEANGSGLRWMQMNMFKDRSCMQSLISRSEKAGYGAIVLSLDQPTVGIRSYGTFTPPSYLSFPNFRDVPSPLMVEDVIDLLDPSYTWREIDWIRSLTHLPIVVKGIMTGEDAIEAVKHGVNGIIVSNHGGRQLDGVPATIDVLGEVVAAVEGKVEVYLDGGIRQGTDVLKAIALGARAVFVGRPILWGLTCNGQEGVLKVFEMLKNEFRTAMMLCGCQSLNDINQDLVKKY